MDRLNFAATVVGHLAWPAVVAVGLVAFRKPISARIDKLRSVTAGKFGAEFGEAERKLESALEVEASNESELPTTPDDDGPREIAPVSSSLRNIRASAKVDPSYAVVCSWSLLDESMSDAASKVAHSPGLKTSASRGGLQAARVLMKLGVISLQTVNAIESLRNLRNHVAHGETTPGAGAALGYVESVGELVELLARKMDRRRTSQHGESHTPSPSSHE